MTIQITDQDARNLSIVLDDGVITTTYTVLKYSCSLEQDVNTIKLRWANEATGAKMYLSIEWSEVTSPVTADADELAQWIVNILANCATVQNVANVITNSYNVSYDDDIVVINGDGLDVYLLPATSKRKVLITNFTNTSSTIYANGSDTIYTRNSSSISSYSINKDLSIMAYSNGIDKWYFIEN